MAASPAQIAANRANAARSTGPRTAEGKDAARRNALKHGLAGAGVVLPGEDEHEVNHRAEALQAELAPGPGAMAILLVRQIAMESIRAERAFRCEKALAAERMRRAGDAYMETRRTDAAELFAAIAADPASIRRRLIAAPEGVDLLVGRLRALRERAKPDAFVVWDDAEGAELDRCLGWRPEADVKSRVGLLTRAIVYDHWVGLDPAEFAGLDFAARLAWAVAQIGGVIAAEIDHLEAHRATIDAGRVEQGRAEAAERALLDLGPQGQALRRYAGAAGRAMSHAYKQLQALRAEPRPGVAEPVARAEVVRPMAPAGPDSNETGRDPASFRSPPDLRPVAPAPAAVASILADLRMAHVPITVGRPPRKAPPAGS